ncbi:hypothetical protein ABZW30_33790 [Kitasatospora sp. NPDC004669]
MHRTARTALAGHIVDHRTHSSHFEEIVELLRRYGVTAVFR